MSELGLCVVQASGVTSNDLRADTPAWILQTWASFVLATVASSLGIYYLPVDAWMRGFLALSFLFTVASCFTLAKTIRDNHEGTRLVNRVRDAKAEQILREFETETA